MAERAGDVLLFLTIVGLVVAVGIAVGMIVAGRLDRLLTTRPAPPADEGAKAPTQEDQP
jgi:hypothetical protein